MVKGKYRSKYLLKLVGVLVMVFLLIVVSVRQSAADPVSENGRLQVISNQLCNSRGYPIQLRGMSTHGLQWFGWGDCINDSSLDALANDWGADILRVSNYPDEGGYKTDPMRYRAMIDTLVNETVERGIYVILDWHMLSPGDPWYNINEARSFFEYMSQRHGQKGHVIYELCNEPNGVSWENIKSYAEDIIPRIRQYDPDGIILVGTRAWSSFGISDGSGPNEVINNPLTGDNAHNVMYTFHFYAASHGQSYRKGFRYAADHLPVFVTEWGSVTYSGDGLNDLQSTQLWIDLMAEKKISWTNWNWADDWRSASAFVTNTCPNGPWTGGTLKESGQLVLNYIQEPPDDFSGVDLQRPEAPGNLRIIGSITLFRLLD